MMRSLLLLLVATVIAGSPLQADPILRIDKGQGESALALIREGDSVRLYCKPCSEVVYSSLKVRSREVRPSGLRYQLLVNGEPLDVSLAYVDDGFGDGWENLAHKLGFVVDGAPRRLAAALDDVSRLAAHDGTYSGMIGERAVRVKLVRDGRRLDGAYEDTGRSFDLLATSYDATRDNEILTLIERDAGDRVTATWRGELDAARGSFLGSRTPLDGSGTQPFELFRVDSAEVEP